MLLPIADTATVRSTALRLVKEHRTALVVVVVLHTFAALFGLVGPWLIGRIIDAMTNGNATGTTVDIMALVLIAAVVCQGLVTRFAQWQAMVLGETVFAALREEFMRIVGHLPLSTVESAGTGDLLARTTNDIESVQATVRFGVPRILVASVTVILTVVAAFVTGPAIAPALFIGVPLLVVTTRWYLRRSGPGYQRQLASYARLAGAISETVEGARTIDALNLAAVQRSKIDKALLERRDAERYTLGLRTVWFPSTDMAFLIPVVAVVAWGAFLTTTGVTSIGAVTTIALYAMQLSSPVGELIRWMDEIQVGTTALSRIIGVGDVPPDREASDEEPVDEQLIADDVRYAYRSGVEVLHGITLVLAEGERLAIVGPSGSGKSTLARMLAGINGPTSGHVTVGGVDLTSLPLERLRSHVALVTQEHHVFVGTLADNLRLAAPRADRAALESALEVVGALGWVRAMPAGLRTKVGSGGVVLTPAQAQQIALARLVLLDPQTLILDEATSLLDPNAARDLETAMNRVLHGRTVVAIAHRLHTAHDADRIAVVQDGSIVELGSHDELVTAGGEYAALWTSWHHEESGHA
ncbi:ABC-type multidrug transport system, ATPase and permease component [Paramicrobacterium humi]|uniref:ABC-type multidrug transport system, ATPase and permease component n=1 Tax=Paramicrobacterium humi TaxID=640635 RepID=A0A1H4KJP3_9MICO|nr:ABC transporter ATP-binding protein [Microbacterium humi]SEB58142.1 ABC-type multidrug transport system, ATPase and permease component [Microbacterium humi]